MILNRKLTPAERKASQRNHLLFSLVNGVSYMCLGENVVILLAVHLAAPSALVALIGSMLYIGYLALPIGVRRTAKVGAAACQADFWICRNLAALLIAASVPVALASPHVAWGMIIVGSFLFYACRAAGCVMGMPLVGEIATQDEIPAFLGANNKCFYESGVVAIVAVAALTHYFKGVWTLVGIIVFGAACGFTSSRFIRGIDESGAVKEAAGRRLIPGMREVLRNSNVRRLTLAWFSSNLAFVMLVPLSVLALRRGCGFSDTEVLFCAVAQFAAGCLVSPPSGRLCRHLGPRAVMAFAFATCLVPAVAWCFFPSVPGAPTTAAHVLALAMFVLFGTSIIATTNALTSYFLMVCPEAKDQVPGTIAVQLLASVGAGLCGSAAASGLLTVAKRLTDMEGSSVFAGDMFPHPIGQFRLYFMLATPLFLLCLVPIIRLRTVIHEFHGKYGLKAVEHVILMSLHHLARRH